VVEKAIQTVYSDGLAFRQVPQRLARDFWVCPHEKMVRLWCQAYSQTLDFEADYQPWVVAEFSGILCIDEVYQGSLALLLAVDPAAAEGDRLVGYQLVHGKINTQIVEDFLKRLAWAGIQPAQVITDGSTLYPTVLAKVWPTAAHQLCLFHETRRVTQAALAALRSLRKSLPDHSPSPTEPNDRLRQEWQQKHYLHQTQLAQLQALASLGYSQRAISRQLHLDRRFVKKGLGEPVSPELLEQALAQAKAELGEMVELTAPQPGKRLALALREQREREREGKACIKLWRRLLRSEPVTLTFLRAEVSLQTIQDLAKQGFSFRAIARQTGLDRRTVKKWLLQACAMQQTATQSLFQPEKEKLELNKKEVDSAKGEAELATLTLGQANTEAEAVINELSGQGVRRRSSKKVRLNQVRELAAQKLSYSEIARRTGVHRVSVSQWLQQDRAEKLAAQTQSALVLPVEANPALSTKAAAQPPTPSQPPPENLPGPALPLQSADAQSSSLAIPSQVEHQTPKVVVEAVLPPPPWQSWQEVRELRELLSKGRFVVLKRPGQLDEKEQAQLSALINSPLGEQVGLIRSFVLAWYGIWRNEDGQRPTFGQAHERYEQWQTNPNYQSLPSLKRSQLQFKESRFEKLAQFLGKGEGRWEATNNGAERTGRAFRHQQAPHFNLRKQPSIEGALVAWAFGKKKAAQIQSSASEASQLRALGSERGRHRKLEQRQSACGFAKAG
jgi:DNA invertase Pin-like site-specific DNA recombinase